MIKTQEIIETLCEKGWYNWEVGKVSVFARDKRGQWHETYFSGIPGKVVPKVARVDYHGSLCDLDLWAVEKVSANKHQPLFQLKDWEVVYS
jgi:hypothetical protein